MITNRVLYLLNSSVVLPLMFFAFPIAFNMGLFILAHQTIVCLEVIEIQLNIGIVNDLNIVHIFILVFLIRFLSQLVEVYLRIEIHLWLLVLDLFML